MAGGTEKGEEEGKMRIDGSGESTLYHGIKKNQRRLAMFWIIARDGSFFLFVNVCVCASKREKGREKERERDDGKWSFGFWSSMRAYYAFLTSTTMDRERDE